MRKTIAENQSRGRKERTVGFEDQKQQTAYANGQWFFIYNPELGHYG